MQGSLAPPTGNGRSGRVHLQPHVEAVVEVTRDALHGDKRGVDSGSAEDTLLHENSPGMQSHVPAPCFVQ
jgi:hypothetical protein